MRCASLVLTLLVSSQALAQSYELYGVGPKSVAMVGAAASAEDDYAATFYNPAMLKAGNVGFSFRWSKPFTSVTPSGEPIAGQKLEPKLPVDFAGWSFGFAAPLFGLLKDRATLGLAVFLPHRQVFRTVMIDEATPYFFRYDNAPARILINFGASARPWKWLSIGGGAQVMSDYGGEATFTAVLGTTAPGRILERELGSEIKGVVAPILGLELGPFEQLPGPLSGFKAFFSFRGQLLAIYELPINVDLGTFGALQVLVRGVSHFAPNVISWGVAWTGLDGRLLLTADLTWEQWSEVNKHPLAADVSIGLGGTLIDLGFNPDILSAPIDMGFHDTLTPRVAAEYRVLPRLPIRLGYGFRPTPSPAQSGRTNFLDGSAHLLGLGLAYEFDDPLKMAKAFAIDLGGQLQVMHDGQVVKEGPNRVQNYTFSGSVMTLTAGLRYQF
jgi:hypothetical protein